MNINNEFPVVIFANEFNGKRYYKAGLSKKDVDGNYIKGYKDVKFKKDVVLHNKTKIKIQKAWLDFYLKDKKTIDFIFISEFEILEEEQKELESSNNTDLINDAELYEINDDELPF